MNTPLKSALALCLLAVAAAQAEAPAPDRRMVTVSGQGEVSGAPDRARLGMAVEETSTDLKAAQARVNGVVRTYLTQARALGAKDEDLSTAGLSINSEYDYSGGKGRKFVGYHVTRTITVVVRDLDKIGDYLQRATDAGINNVSNPQLESSKADDLGRQALAKAALDAQAKAKVLADALGVKLGTVRTISASSEISRPPPGPQPRVMLMAAAAAPSGKDEMGFAAGEIRYTSNINAEFDLVP
jgi:uncharacterized protein YggE